MKKILFTVWALISISYCNAQIMVKTNPSATCFSDVAVYQWSADKGDIILYIAQIDSTSQASNYIDGYIIVLGKHNNKIYAIEGGIEDDARGGQFSNLTITGSGGYRNVIKLFCGNDFEEHEPQPISASSKIIKHKLHNIFKEHLLNSNNLQTILIETSNYNPKNQNEAGKIEYPGYVLKYSINEKTIYWDFCINTVTGWCMFAWKSWSE